MNKAGFLVLGTVMAIGSLLTAAVGCGSTTSGTGGAGGGTGGAASTSSSSKSTSTSTTSSSSTSGSSSSSGGGGLTCKAYCTSIMAACKDPAATQQYNDETSCENSCASFPVGKDTDTSGDTLGCRTYHAGVAAATPATHCGHAGPTGGDGTCGTSCEAFCDLALAVCKAQYADKATCMTECATFKKTASYSVADTATNDAGCRMYHLTVAATGAAQAATHCPHIVAASAVCIK